MEKMNTLGQTPEDIINLAKQRLQNAEEALADYQKQKLAAEARGDKDAIALAETRIEPVKAEVEEARGHLEKVKNSA